MQLRLRSDRVQSAGPLGGTPRIDVTLSIQSIQMDNQLSNAAFPVMLCRRDLTSASSADSRGGNGLLKAAQRQWEQQAQGPPLVQVHIERLLQHTTNNSDNDGNDGNVFLRFVTYACSTCAPGFACMSRPEKGHWHALVRQLLCPVRWTSVR